MLSSSSSSSSFFFLHGSYLMSSITPSPLQFFKWDHFQTCSLNFTLIGSSCKFFWFLNFFIVLLLKGLLKVFISFWFKILNFRRKKKKNSFHFDHGVLSRGFLQFVAFHQSFVYKKILWFTKSVLRDFMFLSSFNNLKRIVSFCFVLFVSFPIFESMNNGIKIILWIMFFFLVLRLLSALFDGKWNDTLLLNNLLGGGLILSFLSRLPSSQQQPPLLPSTHPPTQ